MAEAGQLSPSLDPRRFTLDEVDEAYRLIAEGLARGKLSIGIEEASAIMREQTAAAIGSRFRGKF